MVRQAFPPGTVVEGNAHIELSRVLHQYVTTLNANRAVHIGNAEIKNFVLEHAGHIESLNVETLASAIVNKLSVVFPHLIEAAHKAADHPQDRTLTPEALASFKQHLHNYYTNKENSHIKLIFGGSAPIQDCYINLAMTEESTQQKQEKESLEKQQTQQRKNILSSWEDIYSHKEKKPIALADIFKPITQQSNNTSATKDKPCRKVVIRGRAGIGKTTLCRHIGYRWAKEDYEDDKKDKLWPGKFDIVIWLKLRNLNNDTYKEVANLATILEIELLQSGARPAILTGESVVDFIAKHRDKVLYLLDGWDEFGDHCSNCHKAIQEVLDYSQQHVIITSRPFADINSYMDKHLENIGFTEDTIKKYTKKFFKDNTLFLTFLKQNASAYGLAHVPINLELLCSVWETETLDNPITMTMLYRKITTKLWKRYYDRQKELSTSNLQDKATATKALTQERIKAKTYLRKLAFAGMQQRNIVFMHAFIETNMLGIYEDDEEMVAEMFDEYIQPVLDAGWLHSSSSNKHNDKETYHFLHLTFQEYFAAKYLLESLHSSNNLKVQEAIDFITYKRYRPNYRMVFRFCAGLLHQESSEKNIEAKAKFWQAINNNKVEDLTGYGRFYLHSELLEEVISEDEVEIEDSFKNKIKFLADWYIYVRDELISIKADKHLNSLPKIRKQILHILSNQDYYVNLLQEQDDNLYQNIKTDLNDLILALRNFSGEWDKELVLKFIDRMKNVYLSLGKITDMLDNVLRNDEDSTQIKNLLKKISELMRDKSSDLFKLRGKKENQESWRRTGGLVRGLGILALTISASFTIYTKLLEQQKNKEEILAKLSKESLGNRIVDILDTIEKWINEPNWFRKTLKEFSLNLIVKINETDLIQYLPIFVTEYFDIINLKFNDHSKTSVASSIKKSLFFFNEFKEGFREYKGNTNSRKNKVLTSQLSLSNFKNITKEILCILQLLREYKTNKTSVNLENIIQHVRKTENEKIKIYVWKALAEISTLNVHKEEVVDGLVKCLIMQLSEVHQVEKHKDANFWVRHDILLALNRLNYQYNFETCLLLKENTNVLINQCRFALSANMFIDMLKAYLSDEEKNTEKNAELLAWLGFDVLELSISVSDNTLYLNDFFKSKHKHVKNNLINAFKARLDKIVGNDSDRIREESEHNDLLNSYDPSPVTKTSSHTSETPLPNAEEAHKLKEECVENQTTSFSRS